MKEAAALGWEVVNTADLIADGSLEIGDGYRAKNSEFVREGGLPFVRVGDVREQVHTEGLDELPLDQGDRYKPKISQPGDCLITMKGTVGRVAQVRPATRPFVYSPQISYWRVRNESRLRPSFLRYWLQGSEFDHQAFATKSGTDMADYINLRDQRRMRITLPPLDTQRRIAAVLSAFDELIEINERRIELLGELARSLYREWFVHLRFPGYAGLELVDSELGPIPEGWDVRGLFEIADVGFGFPFKSSGFSETGKGSVVRIRDIPRGVTNTFTDEEPDTRYRVHDGDVLVGMDGEFYVRQWSGGDSWLNQRVARLRPLGHLSSRQLMLAVTTPIKAWNDAIVGTTVAHLGKRHLEQIRVAVPQPDLLKAAGALFEPLAELQGSCEQRNRQLVATRDLLLPPLVTGRLDISNVNLGVLTPAEVE